MQNILSLYDGRLPENLVLGQWKSELLFRTPVPDRIRAETYQQVGVGAALQKGKVSFIAVTGDASGTAFHLDGVLVRHYPDHILRSNTLRGQLIVGDSATGGRSWKGNLFGLALFNRTLDPTEVMSHYLAWTSGGGKRLETEPGLAALYLFDEGAGQWITDRSRTRLGLFIPRFHHVLQKSILIAPWRDFSLSLAQIADLAINVLGFLPFGFFLFLYRSAVKPHRRLANALIAVLLGAAVSLSIELIQVFLPSRSSSATDLFCNTGGTLLGVLLALAISPGTSLGREVQEG
jgi:VanZ family protein